MLSKKYSSGFGSPALGEAFGRAKQGKVMVASGQWYWVGDDKKKDNVKSSDFEFLTLDREGNPWESLISYQDGKWETKTSNVAEELGKMDDMVGELEQIEKSALDDTKALDILDKLDKVKEAKTKWPHLRLTHLQFSVFDVDLEKPVWRAEFKNWPLISYLKKREDPKTVEVAVDAMTGKLLSYKESEEEPDEEESLEEPGDKQ